MVNWGRSAKTLGTFRRKTKTAASHPDEWPGDELCNCGVHEHMTLPPTHRALYTDYLLIYPSICLYVCVCVSIYLSIYLFIHLWISAFIYPSLYPSIYLSICISVYLAKWKTEGHLPKHFARSEERQSVPLSAANFFSSFLDGAKTLWGNIWTAAKIHPFAAEPQQDFNLYPRAELDTLGMMLDVFGQFRPHLWSESHFLM